MSTFESGEPMTELGGPRIWGGAPVHSHSFGRDHNDKRFQLSSVHSIAIAWSYPVGVGARRSSNTRGIAASERIIINLKSLI